MTRNLWLPRAARGPDSSPRAKHTHSKEDNQSLKLHVANAAALAGHPRRLECRVTPGQISKRRAPAGVYSTSHRFPGPGVACG